MKFEIPIPSNNAKYVSCINTNPYQLTSDLYPYTLMAYSRFLGIKRSYNNDLCWHIDSYDNEEVWYPPVGKCSDYRKAFKKSVPSHSYFVAVPEELLNILLNQSVNCQNIEREPYLDDYIISNYELTKCHGNRYKSIRQSVNRFIHRYNPIVIDLKDIAKPDVYELNRICINQLKANSSDIIGPTKENMISSNVIEEYYNNPNHFISTGIIVDNKLVAFCINEIIEGNNASVGVYLKSNHNYRGAGTFLAVKDAGRQLDRNIQYCNIMADEGSEQLKRSKLLLRPCKIIKKFRFEYV